MVFDSLLLAQSAEATKAAGDTPERWLVIGLLIASVVVPIILSRLICKALKMNDTAGKMSFILITLAVAGVIVYLGEINLGIDLKGGSKLRYEVKASDTSEFKMDTLITAIGQRINSGGVKDIQIRPYGTREVEIIIPDIQQQEVQIIKDLLAKPGFLEFHIIANRTDHSELIEQALKSRANVINNEEGKRIGLWARAGRESKSVVKQGKIL